MVEGGDENMLNFNIGTVWDRIIYQKEASVGVQRMYLL